MTISVSRTGPVILAANDAVSNIVKHNTEFTEIVDFHFEERDYHLTHVRFKASYLFMASYAIKHMITDFERELGALVKSWSMTQNKRQLEVEFRWVIKLEDQ